MGGGAHVVNVVGGGRAEKATLANFTGTIKTSGLAAHNATQVATLDGTAFAQADRALADFTGGVSSMVQGRLNGLSSGNMMAMAYAPETDSRNANAKIFTKAPAIGYEAA